MNQRTALAFFLMFVALLIWQAVFSPPHSTQEGSAPSDSTAVALAPPEEEPAAATKPATPGPADTPSQPSETSPGAGSLFAGDLSASTEGPHLILESDQYRAELDLVGADLRTWTLKKYKTVDGEPVQLIPSRSLDPSGQRAHALRILREDGVVDLSHVRFTAEGSRLESTGDPQAPWRLRVDAEHPQAQVRLVAQASSGPPFILQIGLDNRRSSFSVHAEYALPRTDLSQLQISWPSGIANTEPDTMREYHEFKAAARVGDDTYKTSFNALGKGDGSKGRKTHEGTVSWAGVMGQYFTAFVHDPERRVGRVHFDGDYARHLQTFTLELPLQDETGPGLDYTVYLGPRSYKALQRIDPALTALLDLGPTIFRPVSKFMLWLLLYLHRFIPNYGLVIILISVATKFLFYPLTKSSTRSMREMQLVQPELTKIKDKYKDDQARQSQEMMKLYKEHGINPMAGCLPLLVQMPVFWALFTVLRRTIEVRQAPFWGWISDLSRPEVLFHLPVKLPVIGDHFSLLPILMALGMWLQTKIGTPSSAKGTEGAMASQQKMMSTFMPIFMLFIFYNTPSGLVLYWLVNTVLSVVQTWQIQRNAPKTLAEKKALLQARA
jgi:YidC/Oxa1 family membrane protein insertase